MIIITQRIKLSAPKAREAIYVYATKDTNILSGTCWNKCIVRKSWGRCPTDLFPPFQ